MSEYIVEVPEWVIDVNGNPPFGKDKEIVRCKDCKFEIKGYCSRPDEWVDEFWFPIESDGFCKWGERCELESAEVWNQWSADDVTRSEE